MQPDKLLSQTIQFLRFPLIFSVVVSHTNYVGIVLGGERVVEYGMYPVYDFLYYLIRNQLASLDVASFFVIAGFLFFYKADFNASAYVTKLKNRVNTLLIPYVFWNALNIALLMVVGLVFSGLTSGINTSVTDKSWIDYLRMFWDCGGMRPIADQFWFIRDLMMMAIFSPVLYMAIRYLKVLWVVFLGSLWLFDLMPYVSGFSIEALFFFSLGAWFSLNQKNMATLFMPIKKVLLGVFFTLVVVNMALWYADLRSVYNILHDINILVGMAMIFAWTAYGISEQKIATNKAIWGATFFVFAYHLNAVVFFMKIWLKYLAPYGEVALIVGYVLIPIMVAALGVGLYHLLKKIAPRFTAIIIGGR